jgi:hypothetical protein
MRHLIAIAAIGIGQSLTRPESQPASQSMSQAGKSASQFGKPPRNTSYPPQSDLPRSAKDRLLITHIAERGRRPTGPSRFLTEAGLAQMDSRLAA